MSEARTFEIVKVSLPDAPIGEALDNALQYFLHYSTAETAKSFIEYLEKENYSISDSYGDIADFNETVEETVKAHMDEHEIDSFHRPSMLVAERTLIMLELGILMGIQAERGQLKLPMGRLAEEPKQDAAAEHAPKPDLVVVS